MVKERPQVLFFVLSFTLFQSAHSFGERTDTSAQYQTKVDVSK